VEHQILTQDLILHVLAGVLIALPGIKWRIFFVLGIISGVGKELYDLWDYGLFDPLDMLYTFMGVAIVAIPCYLTRFILSYYKSTKG